MRRLLRKYWARLFSVPYPLFACTLRGYMRGFIVERDGKLYGYAARIYIWSWWRGIKRDYYKFALHDRWVKVLQRHGITTSVAMIYNSHPRLVYIITEFGGYKVHAVDKVFTKVHLNLDNPEHMKEYAAKREIARRLLHSKEN